MRKWRRGMADGDYERGRGRELEQTAARLKALAAERARKAQGGSVLTLASQSPRRAKILEAQGVAFEVVKTDAPEISLDAEPERTVLENAVAKAKACGREPALAADTIVWLDGKIYGKPKDAETAKRYLGELSGRTHTVFTGVAYAAGGGIRTTCGKSRVRFKELSEGEIEAYIVKANPLDRAGAYDIDENGGDLIAGYEGEYENIMGLPVAALREFGLI